MLQIMVGKGLQSVSVLDYLLWDISFMHKGLYSRTAEVVLRVPTLSFYSGFIVTFSSVFDMLSTLLILIISSEIH